MAQKWLNSIENPSGTVTRWALELKQFDFEVNHLQGNLNVVADALSRQPLSEEGCRPTVRITEPAEHTRYECKWIAKLRQNLEKKVFRRDGGVHRGIPAHSTSSRPRRGSHLEMMQPRQGILGAVRLLHELQPATTGPDCIVTCVHMCSAAKCVNVTSHANCRLLVRC